MRSATWICGRPPATRTGTWRAAPPASSSCGDAVGGPARRARPAGHRSRGHDLQGETGPAARSGRAFHGLVPAQDGERLARVLGVNLDDDGFVEILDRKNRATETSARRHFCVRLGGRSQGAGGVQHRGVGGGRRSPQLPGFLGAAACGRPKCAPIVAWAADVCRPVCPLARSRLVERPAEAPRPAEACGGRSAGRNRSGRMPPCGICAAVVPKWPSAQPEPTRRPHRPPAPAGGGRRTARPWVLLQGVRRRGDQS